MELENTIFWAITVKTDPGMKHQWNLNLGGGGSLVKIGILPNRKLSTYILLMTKKNSNYTTEKSENILCMWKKLTESKQE